MPSEQTAELERALEQARADSLPPPQLIDALNALAWDLRSDDHDRSHKLSVEARELAIEHGYKLGQARAARTLAMTIPDPEKLPEFFPLAEEAKRLFDEVGDKPGMAGARDFLASLYEFVGDLAGGLELALDALSISKEINDPVRQGYALSSIGGILAASGEVDTAIERLEEAMELFQKAENPFGVGQILSRLCKVTKNAERYDEALEYANRCLKLSDDVRSDYFLWSGNTVLAEIAEHQGNLDEAEELYRKALGCFDTEISRNVVGAETQIALGKLLLRQKKVAAAEVELLDVMRRTEAYPFSVVVLASGHEALADLFEEKQDLPKTVAHLRSAQELRAQIAQRDSRNKSVQVEVRAAMEAAKKEAEYQKLRFVELHTMQSKLVEAEKMALLGKLAAGTAHELNTPLGVLQSNSKLVVTATERLAALVKESKGDAAKAGRLEKVLRSCQSTNDEALERLGAIAHSFKRFTQLDQAERRTFNVHEGLDAAIELLEPTISDKVQFRRGFAEVPLVQGWPRELNFAFMTVLQNAAQAIDGRGVVYTRTQLKMDGVLVEIEDTGRGMTEEQVSHLFDVAWDKEGKRTKMRLGLSAAYTTMQKHQGTIEVESHLGKGTIVRFWVPAMAQ